MKKLQAVVAALLVAVGVGFTLQPAAGAIDITSTTCQNSANANSPICKETKNASAKTSSLIQQTINTLLFILGTIAVIMIIVGGIRYTLSGGDSSAVSSAKNTILYSAVGLVVAMLAYGIVNFILGSF